MKKRKALSRVLTEIIFLILGLTTAVGAYSLYNSSILSTSQVAKIVCTDTIIAAGSQEVNVIVKNIGNIAVEVSVEAVSEYGRSENLSITKGNRILLEPGMEKMITTKCSGLIAGLRYNVFVTARVNDEIVGYVIAESIALP
ncbi:MAG: hypothetical protein N3F64_00610 [Nitrososphaeria archaeon]|nr:hypothetical protein [Nitrososphaeria archaeon]